jgi:hypothetical protein
MNEFEKDLRILCDQAALALLGARNGGGAIVQAEVRHTVLMEVLGLYTGHKITGN